MKHPEAQPRPYRAIVSGDPLRIALVVGSLEVGGTETQLCRLAVELQQRGHPVKVFAMRSGGPLEDQLVEGSVPFQIVGFAGLAYRNADRRPALSTVRYSLRELRSYWRTLLRFEPDVCHAFLPAACQLTLPGAALGGVPVRIAGRRSLPSALDSCGKDRALGHLALTFTNAIIANSQAIADDSVRTDRASRNRIHVIPNAVDIPACSSDVTQSPAMGLMIANLIAYKGHRDFLGAMQLLRHPPAIRLVGDGPERNDIARRIEAGGLAGVVTLAGSVRDAARLYRDVQFAVLASHQEGMPNSVLEAMSYGVPVVATAVGGVNELLQHEVNGLLVRPHQPAELAAAIERLSGQARLRERLGGAARERAKLLGWTRCVDAHEQLYIQLYNQQFYRLRRRPPVARFG